MKYIKPFLYESRQDVIDNALSFLKGSHKYIDDSNLQLITKEEMEELDYILDLFNEIVDKHNLVNVPYTGYGGRMVFNKGEYCIWMGKCHKIYVRAYGLREDVVAFGDKLTELGYVVGKWPTLDLISITLPGNIHEEFWPFNKKDKLTSVSEPAIIRKPDPISEDDMADIKDMFTRYADEWNLTYSDTDAYDTYTMTMKMVNQGGIRGGRWQGGINPEMTVDMKIWFDTRSYKVDTDGKRSQCIAIDNDVKQFVKSLNDMGYLCKITHDSTKASAPIMASLSYYRIEIRT